MWNGRQRVLPAIFNLFVPLPARTAPAQRDLRSARRGYTLRPDIIADAEGDLMHHDDIDQIMNALDAIESVAATILEHARHMSLRDAGALTSSTDWLFKLAKPLIEIMRRDSLPSTQNIELPSLVVAPVLFTSAIHVQSYATSRLTTGAPNC